VCHRAVDPVLLFEPEGTVLSEYSEARRDGSDAG
jgi:hypothetical protein